MITVSNLGKRYTIAHSGQRRGAYRRFSEDLASAFTWPIRKLRASINGHATASSTSEEFWALRDVNFEVEQGQVVGVIGRNGAGKSTLLKLLSRITEPTTGRIELRGRVASLLEVGTGFHPELTGRENVFLNGAILGMTKSEIKRKFDEIVAFAEVEKFLDTPVKRYSSGMHVRLAFAVAAHLDPEILLVDEVLAVGDAQFQKKCLGTMQSVAAKQGRTILFVSHNMAAVRSLCTRGILLQDGRIAMMGAAHSVVGSYLEDAELQQSAQEWPDLATAPGNEHVRLRYVRVSPPEGEDDLSIDTGAALEVCFYTPRENINLDCTIYVVNSEGLVLFETGCMVSTNNDSQAGYYRIRGALPPHFLNAGRYYVNVLFGLDQHYVLYKRDSVVSFHVENTLTGRGRNMHVTQGVVRPLIHWAYEFSQTPYSLGREASVEV